MIDKSVFPGLQGGPLMNNILGKAICFKDAKKKSFKNYQVQVLNNMKELSENLVKGGFKLVSQGTDTHLALIKVNHLGLTGHNCQNSLENINIFVNKNKIPFDTKSAFSASGFRIGTAAVTSLGMKSIEMKVIADLIIRKLIKNESSQKLQNEVKCLLYSYRKKMLTDFY
jgi:glycine hydroxymethyltransferase